MKGHSSLSVFDFGVLLQALAGSLKEGTLRVVSGNSEKYIHVNLGQIEAIYTPRSRFRVGRLLHNMRAIEMEDLMRVLDEQRKQKIRVPLGELLVQRNLVEREDLEAALQYQIVEEVLEVFYWEDVAYEFFSVPPTTILDGRAKRMAKLEARKEAPEVLLEVTKVIDDLEKFNATNPSLKDVFELVGNYREYIESCEDPEYVRELLDLVDGERDMGQLLKDMRVNRLEALELLYRLRVEGLTRAKNSFELLMLAENRRNSLPPQKRARLLERAAELGVEGFEISLKTAQAYEELNEPDKAAEHYYDHARQMEQEQNPAAAIEAAARSVELNPDRVEVREYRVEILGKLDRWEEVARELLELGRLHQRKGDYEAAEQALLRALDLAPQSTDLQLARVDVLQAAGESWRAAQACVDLAKLRQDGGDVEEALAMLRRAVEIEPASMRFRNALVTLLAEAGQNLKAAESIGEMVPVVLERTEGKTDRGVSILLSLKERIDELNARVSPSMERLAEALLKLGKKSAALEILSQAGEARIAVGKLAEAKDAYERAVTLAPVDLDLAETLALVQARLGHKEHALARLRSIAGQFWKRGKLDRAEHAYKEMLRLDPFSPDALLELARLKGDQGKRQEAALGLFQIGHLYRVAGNLEDAVTYFDEACKLDPGNPRIVRELAETLGQALKTERSLDSFDALLAMLRARSDHTGVIDLAFRILSVDPDHEDACQALEDSYRSLGKKLKGSLAKTASRRNPNPTPSA